VPAISLFTGLALTALIGACSGRPWAARAAETTQGPPRIVSTSPAVGATEVDPGLAEITVTFDRDMGGGMSWTGGGPEFPVSPPGARAQWQDKRTCVLPVQLQAGHHYRVGINSMSYHNFRSADGVPATPSAITFTTKGASEPLKPKGPAPRIVGLNPLNGAKDVSPGLTELRITFNVPMGEGFSWTGGGPEFPTIPEGKKPHWAQDQKTCVLPVELKANSTYRLGLNSPSHKGFQSADGVPLPPVVYTFQTGEK
jgi:hypothetical protein